MSGVYDLDDIVARVFQKAVMPEAAMPKECDTLSWCILLSLSFPSSTPFTDLTIVTAATNDIFQGSLSATLSPLALPTDGDARQPALCYTATTSDPTTIMEAGTSQQLCEKT